MNSKLQEASLHNNTSVKSLSSKIYNETPYAVCTCFCMLQFRPDHDRYYNRKSVRREQNLWHRVVRFSRDVQLLTFQNLQFIQQLRIFESYQCSTSNGTTNNSALNLCSAWVNLNLFLFLAYICNLPHFEYISISFIAI